MYKHILFATDFSSEASIAEARAVEVAKQNQAKLSLIHVIDEYPTVGVEAGLTYLPDLEEQITKQANENMASCIARTNLTPDVAYVEHGSPKRVITECAEEIGADLIVLGSHGRHGLGLLLGSTANAVLHAAKCDVLAVRVYK